MIPKVFIETTIPSFYYDTRKGAEVMHCRESTRFWWGIHSERYELFTSRFVLLELSRAPEAKRKNALTLMAGVNVLPEPADLEDVVAFYIDNKLMPADEGGDAVHLAFASLYKMDFLLTWNCEHLANANKARHIMVLNNRLGLFVPIVTTPDLLIPEDAP